MKRYSIKNTKKYKRTHRKLMSNCNKLKKKATKAELVILKRLLRKDIKHVFQLPLCLFKQSGFIADFYFPNTGIILEVDGKIHNKRKRYDRFREKVILERVLEVKRIVRIKNEDVFKMSYKELDSFLKSIS